MDYRASIHQLSAEMKLSEPDETSDSTTLRVDPPGSLDSQDDLRPNENFIFESVEQNPYEMSYTCLLLSRFDSNSLIADAAVCLQACLKEICTSFGWNLEFLTIEPTYLHWTVRVPPATSTAQIMKVVREQTSIKLLTDFPHLKRENQSDDFWAPGYLIFWGSQPHPIEIIQRFIRQTRQQQGS